MVATVEADSALRASSWVWTTTVGWYVGFALMLGLVFLGEAVVGPTQAVVGLGMGAGLGFWQARRLRGVLERPWRWGVATTAGIGFPFVLWDLSPAIGAEPRFSLPVCVVAGGIAVAAWQWRLLAGVSHRAAAWLPAGALGWALPAAAIGLADAHVVPDLGIAVLRLSGMFLGGAMLGAATARPLVWILRAAPAQPSRDGRPSS